MSEHTNLHLVFNRPPVGISDEEFNRWALTHFDEIMAIPGWVSARRFRLDADVKTDPPIPFSYMSLYELSGDPDAAVAQMHKGQYDYPSWFKQAQAEGCFASWNCIGISGKTEASGR